MPISGDTLYHVDLLYQTSRIIQSLVIALYNNAEDECTISHISSTLNNKMLSDILIETFVVSLSVKKPKQGLKISQKYFLYTAN
jgi:hypothetical protein